MHDVVCVAVCESPGIKPMHSDIRVNLNSNLLDVLERHAIQPLVFNHHIEERSERSVLHHNADYRRLRGHDLPRSLSKKHP